MKVENSQVYNFENALRGMRNPKNSWKLSDSEYGMCDIDDISIPTLNTYQKYHGEGATLTPEEYTELANKIMIRRNGNICEYAAIGPKDMKLAQTLIKAGPEHRKFLRQIFVTADITTSLFHWKELDTYKVSTVANSTSTMHKLTSNPITIDCFETDDCEDIEVYDGATTGEFFTQVIDHCEQLRQKFLETGDKRYWKELIRLLPESWLQTRTWTANYETLQAIYHQRKCHRLTEWHTFCSWIETLPYAKELICDVDF